MSEHATVLDSDEQQVGTLYAKALLGSAGDAVDEILSDFEALVVECLDQHPGLETALASPRIGQEEKEGILDRIFRNRVHPLLLNFLKVLCRRDRIASLRTIQTTAVQMREEALGKQRVIVQTAQALSDEQKATIAEALKNKLGKDAVLIEQVDESLLGGIVLRIGDKVLDGSILGRMNSIRSVVAEGVQRAIRNQYDSLMSS
ncbi:MAG: ATP synthase F1 subunit delta [bacterium]|nr:ATP synthase F1 subunit delta [bacterium]